MEIQIERTPGFSGADGDNVSYNTVNEAFNAYLSATGQPKTKASKAQFKAWLQKAKDSGKLDKVLAGGKEKIQQVIAQQRDKMAAASTAAATQIEEAPAPETKKPTKIMGMPPMVAVGVIVASVALISWGVYMVVKKSKAKQGTA